MLIRTAIPALVFCGLAVAYTLEDSVTAAGHLLGTHRPCSGRYCNWMSAQYWGDSSLLQLMTIPGTHDSSTWRFGTDIEWTYFLDPLVRCQTINIFDQLNAGVRFFDLRFGVSATGPMKLLMHHGPVQLDRFVELQDVVAGIAYWLTQNPTETALLSIKQDDGLGSPEAEAEFAKLFTNETLAPHWVQLDNQLPTLGAARGKMVLLSRYATTPYDWGIKVNDNWIDNGEHFEIHPPNSTMNVSIEDAYTIPFDIGDNPQQVIWKSTVAKAQLERAAQYTSAAYTAGTPLTAQVATLFVTFVSGTRAEFRKLLKSGGNLASLYSAPHELALGNNGPGVNAEIVGYLANRTHAPDTRTQLGIIVFDFITDLPGTIDAILDLDNQPDSPQKRNGPARLSPAAYWEPGD